VKRRHLLITGSLIIGIMIVVLCSCDLITTDKDRFTLDKNDYITMIDLDKTGPNVVIPEKIEDKNIRGLYLYDPYFSEIDSIDVSNASQLEYVSMDLFGGGKKSKIKKLDFSKNTKLRNVVINRTNALNRIIFNERCETISLFNTSIKELDLKSLKNLSIFLIIAVHLKKSTFPIILV
jgi:lipoprotein